MITAHYQAATPRGPPTVRKAMLDEPDPSQVFANPGGGDQRTALLLEPLYKQLRAVAQRWMAGERRDHTLQATALVHEAYIRLVENRRIAWRSKGHFYASVAEAMRYVLIDHARTKRRVKRGGNARRMPDSVLDLLVDCDADQIHSVNEAVDRLQQENPQLAEIVRLRFYVGLSLDETADVMGLPTRTLDRRWLFAKAWLFRALNDTERQGTRE
jgi:RNA polymerase sigma factor (TIGR02999 family)